MVFPTYCRTGSCKSIRCEASRRKHREYEYSSSPFPLSFRYFIISSQRKVPWKTCMVLRKVPWETCAVPKKVPWKTCTKRTKQSHKQLTSRCLNEKSRNIWRNGRVTSIRCRSLSKDVANAERHSLCSILPIRIMNRCNGVNTLFLYVRIFEADVSSIHHTTPCFATLLRGY